MISVVLPTYNERDGIAELASEILAVVRAARLDAEVLVVDDDSPDGTAAHLAEVFRDEPAVRVHVRRGERGLASAIQRGLVEARGDTLVVMEAMKMEHTLAAPRDGKIIEVNASAGAQTAEGVVLVKLEPQPE